MRRKVDAMDSLQSAAQFPDIESESNQSENFLFVVNTIEIFLSLDLERTPEEKCNFCSQCYDIRPVYHS